MSLQFIIGKSGSGKSTWLYEQVISESLANPEKNYLFIVPEQFTMQTQKEFVRRHPRHGILNIDVLSFQRLAYRVFDEVGGFHMPVLDDTGKTLVLRKVCENNKSRFQVLKSSIQKQGTMEELKSLLSEFIQYQVKSEKLAELAEHTKNANLRCKLQDMRILYDGFFQYLEDHFITSDQTPDLLCSVIDRSSLVKGSVIVLDGFTGFTPQQCALLHHLMRLSAQMLVAVTIDEASSGRGLLEEHRLFALSAKTMHTLRRIASEEQIEMDPTVCLGEETKNRFAGTPPLRHLEQNLFRVQANPYRGEDTGDAIRVLEAPDPVRELQFVASRIRRLVRREGYRYGQIAVVTGDTARYGPYLERVFSAYEIPYFLDNTAPILLNPMIETIRALLKMVTEQFSYTSVFRYFRCGLSGTAVEEIDRLENYVLAFGVRGFSMWREVWVRRTKDMTPEELARLNEIRQGFVEDMEAFVRVCGSSKTTVREKTEALYSFLVKKGLQQQLACRKEAFLQEGQLARAKEYGQVYGVIMDLLDQYVTLLGDEKMGIREYADILEAGMTAPKIGVLPPGTDYVVTGDIERTRLTDISVLFFIGVNDGVVPKAPQSGGVLSELERESLARKDLALAPTQRENFFIQKFYLYLLVTKASEKLYVSYSTNTTAGETLRPSYFIQTLRRLFPALLVEKIPEYQKLQASETEEEVLACLRRGFSGEKPDRMWREMYARFWQREEMRPAIQKMQQAGGFSGQEPGIGRTLAHRLFGGLSGAGVTRLETFAGCPYAHFLQYGLKLREREVFQYTPVDNGIIFHEALERYGNILSMEGLSMADDIGERQGILADRCIEESLAGLGGDRLMVTARGQYHVQRMKRLMRRTVWAIGKQLRRGRFRTANFELDFSAEDGIYPVPLFDEKEIMRLGGRIDRMDVLDEGENRYLRVIDYKTGRQEFSLLKFYHGLQLQLVVYLQAAMRIQKKKYPGKEIVPAGIFYYRLEDPLLEESGELPEEERQEQVLAKLKLDGYVNSDLEIPAKMDGSGMQRSSVIPVSYKKDGTLGKTGTKAADGEQMSLMMRYSDQVLRKLGEGILSGDTGVKPYRLERESACRFCGYGSVCGFDRRIPCYRYRRLSVPGTEAIWEEMEESVCQHNGQTGSGK